MRFSLISSIIILSILSFSACAQVDPIIDRMQLELETLWSCAVTSQPAANDALVQVAGMNDTTLLKMFYVESHKDRTPKEERLRQAELVQVSFARMLIDSGADAKAKNEADTTALSLAEQNQRDGLVKLFRSKNRK